MCASVCDNIVAVFLAIRTAKDTFQLGIMGFTMAKGATVESKEDRKGEKKKFL